MPSFSSHPVLLKTLFHPRFTYSMPLYQRPFSWTVKEATKLFDDIVDAMGDDEGTPQIEAFFLGAIILTGNMNPIAKKPAAGELTTSLDTILNSQPPLSEELRGAFDVVDGKQRIVTFKILLCLLRDLSSNGDHDIFAQTIGLGQNGNDYRLQLCGGEGEFLNAYILQKGASLIAVSDQSNLSDSQKNLILVRDSLHKNLFDLSEKYRSRLLNYMLNQCELVIVLSERIDHAFQIFLSMNDSGLPLAKGDVLKAELMSKLSDPQVEKYRDIWAQWNDSLGEIRGRFGNQKMTFFNHFRFVLTSSPTSLLADFRLMVDAAGGAGPFIDNYLIPNAEAFEIITSATWPENRPHKAEMDKILGLLNWLPHHDWIAPAMQAIQRYKESPDLMFSFFQKLERLSYGLFILPGGAPDRKRKINPLKRALRDDTGKMNPFDTVEFTDIEKKTIRSAIAHTIHKNRPAAAKLLLMRLDMEVTGLPISHYNTLNAKEIETRSKKKKKKDPFSVEHLLPQSPEPNSQWLLDFPDEKTRQALTELLGNLFLVRKESENPRMKNFDLPDKKAILFPQDQDHPIYLTNQLKQQTTWTQDDIAQRHQMLLAVVDKIWPL
ncbi:MAG: DUF262 domain-containing HNH endonuclease family protein [Hyphomicrobiaceae bacterium]|nr:DUF262 domain-containing HNH endonuclease family protein [Hyphomicrobiaceae bacterium]